MKKFISLGAVKEQSLTYHKMYGGRCSFGQLLRRVISYEMPEQDKQQQISLSPELLSEQRFRNFLYSLPINCERILTAEGEKDISEEHTIPQGRDVSGYMHLPFVDDGMHTHNHFELNYVYAGSARQRIAEEERLLKTGELCIISPNMKHNVLVDDEQSLVISIMVRKSTFDLIFGSLLTHNDLLAIFFKDTLYREEQSHFLLFKADDDSTIKKLVQDIIIESNTSQKYSNVYANSLVQQLFYMMMRRYSNTILYYGDEPSLKEHAQFSMILEYVQHHYATVTLSSLAEFFHYSESYLSRLFKKNINIGFNKIIQNLKLEKAEELLTQTDMTIAEITEKIGYDSPDYFTKSFKKYYGSTPSEYRLNGK